MAIDINHTQHSDYLEFKVTGLFDMNDAIEKFQQILDTCRSVKVSKVLIDYKDLQGDMGVTAKTLYALGVEDQYLKYIKSGGQELKIAYLAPMVNTYEPAAEIGKKIEFLQFELFDILDEAIEWLKTETT